MSEKTTQTTLMANRRMNLWRGLIALLLLELAAFAFLYGGVRFLEVLT